MPTYPVKHMQTGETKEFHRTVREYDEWRRTNPDWDKDWSAGVVGVGEVGDWKNKMSKTHPGWNEIMNRASKRRGSTIEW